MPSAEFTALFAVGELVLCVLVFSSPFIAWLLLVVDSSCQCYLVYAAWAIKVSGNSICGMRIDFTRLRLGRTTLGPVILPERKVSLRSNLVGDSPISIL